MSDEIATQSAEPVEGSPTSDSVITETPDTPTLNVQEYSNHRVPVKLDGEELQVPLSEAIAGYQRQADYTRKTQELSQQREKVEFASTLQAALENNPAATLGLLSQHYNVQNTPQVDPIEEESLTVMSNVNFDALLSTTLANYRDQLTDNVFTARPLTYMLNDQGSHPYAQRWYENC
jgi:hypothetical protein